MSASARNPQATRLTVFPSPGQTSQTSAQFIRLSRLRQLRDCEQVAAVCYRVRGGGIEFLLVRTRGNGRWTFPKGGAEPGLSHAQAAALEAFEEAGVHGRIEEASFAQYRRKQRGARKSGSKSDGKGLVINAHLCEVLRLGNPQESRRNRTWFSAQDARRRLREGRSSDDGDEFARVVERAMKRIQQQRGRTGTADGQKEDCPQKDQVRWDTSQKDGLQKVQFEAQINGRVESSRVPYIRRQLGRMRQMFMAGADNQYRETVACEVLEFDPTRESDRRQKLFSTGQKTKALGSGAV